MHTIRMYFGPVDLTYLYVVGFDSGTGIFEPIFVSETLIDAVIMASCLNGGRTPDDISLRWLNIMVPRSGTAAVVVRPQDFKRGTFTLPHPHASKEATDEAQGKEQAQRQTETAQERKAQQAGRTEDDPALGNG